VAQQRQEGSVIGVIFAILALAPCLLAVAWNLRRVADAVERIAETEEAVRAELNEIGQGPSSAEELRKIRLVLERSEAAIEAGLLDEEVEL
jgi:hypothetical protein